MLSQSERVFSVGDKGCVVQLASGVSVESTRTVANVFSDKDLITKVGYISTAEPLGSTGGLKATCCRHREKHKPQCICWVAFSKAKVLTQADRLDLFKSLCSWIADGISVDREEHSTDSYNLRLAAGMTPRPPKTK